MTNMHFLFLSKWTHKGVSGSAPKMYFSKYLIISLYFTNVLLQYVALDNRNLEIQLFRSMLRNQRF